MDFRCRNCTLGFTTFKETINHNINEHPKEVLKYRKLVKKDYVDTKTGKLTSLPSHYITLDLGIIPDDEKLKGNLIEIKSENDTVVLIKDKELDEVKEIVKLLPKVAAILGEKQLLSSWVLLHKLISNCDLPLENLAFSLFIDVVRFYGTDTTTTMTYSEKSKLFWRTGYELFGGKFLRFMGGMKSEGQVIENIEQKGYFKPTEAKINFAVPNIKHLQSNISKKDIKPGLLEENFETLTDCCENQQVKIAFDGKKINASLIKGHGDIDLFGCDDSPTKAESDQRLEDELRQFIRLSEEKRDIEPKELLANVKTVSIRIKELRQASVVKRETLKKLQELGAPDWRTSKYFYAISSIQVSLYQMQDVIKGCLETNDLLLKKCSLINGAGHLYRSGENMNLGSQGNYVCLMNRESPQGSQEINEATERVFVKQRSSAWQDIRKLGKATGSTVSKAIGLSTLKEQQEHCQGLIGCKIPTVFSSCQQEKIQHGVDNEIHALSTLVGKVLPAYFPDLCFVEEGCTILKKNRSPFLIVSPDGSGRRDGLGKAALAFEFKCPSPDKTFTTQVHYTIPWFYITQLLAEMASLQCSELIYMSYSKESTTVFKVTFSEALWKEIWEELGVLYDDKVIRIPKKARPQTKVLKEKIRQFVIHNVDFISEIPSIEGSPCEHDVHAADEIFGYHGKSSFFLEDRDDDILQRAVHKGTKYLEEAHQVSRKRATEILMFMLSDLDRLTDFGIGHSLPIAYGLQGPSIKMDTMKKMLKKVIEACEEKQLDPLVFSCDGQFINLITRDFNDKPLTILQKQKAYWEKVKKQTKQELVTFFEDFCNGEGDPKEPSLVDYKKVSFKERHTHLLAGKIDECEGLAQDPVTKSGSQVIENFNENSTLSTQPFSRQTNVNICLEKEHFESILTLLQSEGGFQGSKKSSTTANDHSTDSLAEMFTSYASINQGLTKEGVKLCLRTIKQLFPDCTKHIKLSASKQDLMTDLAKLIDIPIPALEQKRKHKKCFSLKELCTKKVRNLPKLYLAAMFAEIKFSKEMEIWKQSFPFASESVLIGTNIKISWQTFPASRMRSETALTPLIGVVDSHHILTNLRNKCCSTGIEGRGIKREAWVKVATNNRQNKTGLTTAHVEDMIDKQDNAYAQLTFSEPVEQEMRKNGDHLEAEFCRLIRNWYFAEDEPGIDCLERVEKRLELRAWLLDDFNCCNFPPPSSYVRGIPIVTFEALLTNIERKIQIYGFVRGQSYNPRSVSTLDVEGFFSVLGDLAPGGSSLAIRPKEIPRAIKTACGLAKLHADPKRQRQFCLCFKQRFQHELSITIWFIFHSFKLCSI